jgi:dolichyl-phosphate beta-glucosyltransferase
LGGSSAPVNGYFQRMRPVTLSLVVPAYNEALRLPGTLKRMREHFDALDEGYEVILVDDGSTDGTAAEARGWAEHWPELTVVTLPTNRGKGAAVREGMLRAQAEHRAFSDADLSTPLEELARLRERLSGDCHVAIASRGLPDSDIQIHQPWGREFAGRTYNRILRLLVPLDVLDSQCGLKVFTDTAAVTCFTPLRTARFGFDAEVLMRAQRRGWRVAEVPVRWRHVDASRVSPGRDAVRMLFDLVLLRLTRDDSDALPAPSPTDRATFTTEP